MIELHEIPYGMFDNHLLRNIIKACLRGLRGS